MRDRVRLTKEIVVRVVEDATSNLHALQVSLKEPDLPLHYRKSGVCRVFIILPSALARVLGKELRSRSPPFATWTH